MKKSVCILGLITLFFSTTIFAAPYIRYEAHSPQGQKAILAMQKAISQLKKLPCNNAVSWYYQSAIHGVPNPDTDGDLEKNPLCPWFVSGRNKPYSRWSKCASHNESGPPSDIHFLPWHRLYIAHFEKILRKYSGNPNFALPYWDYEKYPVLPDKFQVSARGSLFEAARQRSLNFGKAIAPTTMNDIYDESSALSDITDYDTYNNQINTGLHNIMHDYIGGTNSSYNKIYNQTMSPGLMGNVPSAAFDPIFWLHHANIDRLWQNWIINHPGQNITLDQLNSVKWPYNFFQDNGTAINYTMPRVLATIKKPDYLYQQQVAPSSGKADLAVLTEQSINSIPLNAEASYNNVANITLSVANEKLLLVDKTANERIVLKLNAAYAGQPDGRYAIYVNLPENYSVNNQAAHRYFAGSISFFVNDPEGHGGEHTFRYDITHELALSKQSLKTIHLTIAKTTGSQKGSITIKNAEVLYLH